MLKEFTNTNIVILLGYMGCGKSTVGAALAQKFNLLFEDLDDRIATAYDGSIPDLFLEKGEKGFRQIEHDLLLETLADRSPRVISLGGGTPCYHNNMEHILQATPHVFYLEGSPAELATRLFPFKSGRPLISHVKDQDELRLFVAKHLFERKTFYMQANHSISVDGKSVDELVLSIAELL